MVSEERKKAFLVYASTYEAAVKHLTYAEMGELFYKLGKIAFEGVNVGSENMGVDMLLSTAKPNMEAAEERHQRAIENGSKGREHGSKGGRPRKGESREEYDARRLERAGSENPEKPLNMNMNINTNTNNTDKDIDIKKETDIEQYKYIDKNNTINKNTNVDVINDSSFTNTFSSLTSNLEEETEQGENLTRGAEPTKQVALNNSKDEGRETNHGERPRQEENPRQGGNNGSKGLSDFIRGISLDDDYEDDVPPCPPDSNRMNYLGNLQDIIRYDAEPDYDEMTDAEMMDAVKDDIDSAIECEIREGHTQRYRDLIHRAKNIYMHLNGCDEGNAKKGVTRLYREREKDLQASMQ